MNGHLNNAVCNIFENGDGVGLVGEEDYEEGDEDVEE
jgi:hypothetical protein